MNSRRASPCSPPGTQILRFEADSMQDVRRRRWQWWLRLALVRIYVRDLYLHTPWANLSNASSSGNSGQEVVRTNYGTCTWIPSDLRISIANNSRVLLERLSLAFYPWTIDQDMQRRYRHGRVPQQVQSLLLAQGAHGPQVFH